MMDSVSVKTIGSRLIPYLVTAGLYGQTSPPADLAALRPLFEQALAARERELGPEHPKVARSASDLGLFLKAHGDPDGAESALRRALAIDLKALGESHPPSRGGPREPG